MCFILLGSKILFCYKLVTLTLFLHVMLCKGSHIPSVINLTEGDSLVYAYVMDVSFTPISDAASQSFKKYIGGKK